MAGKNTVLGRDIEMRYGDDPELRERMKKRKQTLESWGDKPTVDTLEKAEAAYKSRNGYKPVKGLRRF